MDDGTETLSSDTLCFSKIFSSFVLLVKSSRENTTKLLNKCSRKQGTSKSELNKLDSKTCMSATILRKVWKWHRIQWSAAEQMPAWLSVFLRTARCPVFTSCPCFYKIAVKTHLYRDRRSCHHWQSHPKHQGLILLRGSTPDVSTNILSTPG